MKVLMPQLGETVDVGTALAVIDDGSGEVEAEDPEPAGMPEPAGGLA